MTVKKILLVVLSYITAIVFVIGVVAFSNRACEVVFIDVGQGDSAFIMTESGKGILVDGGDEGSGKYTLKEVLKVYNCSELDGVFISHMHDDHFIGIAELLEDGVKIKNLYLGDKTSNTDGYERLLKAAKNMGTVVHTLSEEQNINIDNVNFNVLLNGCEDTSAKDENENTMVLRCTVGETSILFMGDATQNCEDILIDKYYDSDILSADILKIGHHGSATSSSEKFLKAVSPEFGIISVGADNSYSLPDYEVISLLNKLNIPVLRTDLNGTVSVRISDDKEKNILDIHTHKH